MIIYKIQNKINGKIYIGQTIVNLNRRITGHLNAKSFIGNALRKYGLQCFDISVIDTADDLSILSDKEMEYINFYDSRSPNGYNLTTGGEGRPSPHSEETKQKMRKPHGPMSEQAKKNMRKPRGPMSEKNKQAHRKPHGPMPEERKKKYRGPKSEKAKENMSIGQLKRGPHSKEARLNQSNAHIGVPWSKARRDAQNKKIG